MAAKHSGINSKDNLINKLPHPDVLINAFVTGSTAFILLDAIRQMLLPCPYRYLAHGTGTDYMYEVLKVPMAYTWEIYGDNDATFEDCFKMFNPLTKESFEVS